MKRTRNLANDVAQCDRLLFLRVELFGLAT